MRHALALPRTVRVRVSRRRRLGRFLFTVVGAIDTEDR
jgi:hypothetical protein